MMEKSSPPQHSALSALQIEFLVGAGSDAGFRELFYRLESVAFGEIALELGYCDQSAFTSQFRQRMGITPLRYRREFGR